VIEISVIKPDFICNNYLAAQPQRLGKRDVVMVQQRRFRRHSWQSVGAVKIADWRPSHPTFAF
jgi:hypothetical protein